MWWLTLGKYSTPLKLSIAFRVPSHLFPSLLHPFPIRPPLPFPLSVHLQVKLPSPSSPLNPPAHVNGSPQLSSAVQANPAEDGPLVLLTKVFSPPGAAGSPEVQGPCLPLQGSLPTPMVPSCLLAGPTEAVAPLCDSGSRLEVLEARAAVTSFLGWRLDEQLPGQVRFHLPCPQSLRHLL